MNDSSVLDDIKGLQQVEQNPDQLWSVYTYVLVDSKNPGEKGVLYIYGMYHKYDDAIKISEKLARKYESLYFMVRKTRSWQRISEQTTMNNIRYVDDNEKADKIAAKKEQELKEMYEKELSKRARLEAGRVKSLDNSTIEHYIRQYTFAVNKIEYINHLKENLNKEIEKVMETEKYIKKLNETHPNYEKIWLNIFEEKMKDIEDMKYFDIVNKLYKEIDTIETV